LHALLQRVTEASVTVDGTRIAEIGSGLLILVAVVPEDSATIAERLADRAVDLRIFGDSSKLMNRSVVDIGGEVLVVSQFTLAADTRKGRRPSFDSAAPPDQARALYGVFVERIRQRLGRVATGIFGGDMKVALINDGPATFLLN
jgi:D-tyrosyl-tRNA(Tyr) deacylase